MQQVSKVKTETLTLVQEESEKEQQKAVSARDKMWEERLSSMEDELAQKLASKVYFLFSPTHHLIGWFNTHFKSRQGSFSIWDSDRLQHIWIVFFSYWFFYNLFLLSDVFHVTQKLCENWIIYNWCELLKAFWTAVFLFVFLVKKNRILWIAINFFIYIFQIP